MSFGPDNANEVNEPHEGKRKKEVRTPTLRTEQGLGNLGFAVQLPRW